MTGEEFRATIDKLFKLEDPDASKHGNLVKASLFLDMTDRNVRRFVAGEKMPRSLILLLALMTKFKVTPKEALKIAKIKKDS